MSALPWRQPPLTKAQEHELFMLMLEDDTEDAPWMVMGDLQFWSASSFAHSLRTYAHQQHLPWYVASMLPIRYAWGPSKGKKQLAPDCFVAFVPGHARTSYDVGAEGVFPPFVLEVVSPASARRDREEKVHAYDLLDAREYALFTPRSKGPSALAGYRRDEAGQFVPWQPDQDGSLWSNVLELHLVVRDDLLQAQTAGGRLLLTPEQEANARREESRQAQIEIERLRQELDRLR
jgi:Uma2 family endonuclease